MLSEQILFADGGDYKCGLMAGDYNIHLLGVSR